MSLMEISDISSMLSDRIDQLVVTILPGAVKEGHEWRCGSIAGEKGRSMGIHATGPRSGTWCDFSNQLHKGDALDLVAWVMFAGDKAKAVAWAKSWLGIDNMDPDRLAQQRALVQAKKERQDRQAKEQAEKRSRTAQAIWLNASPALAGSPVDQYLLGRGIGLCDLNHMPGSLRFTSKLKYWDHKVQAESYWPAMVAAIHNHEGEFIAVHRTYLKNYGGGLVKKAPVPDAKLTLGSYRGGSIPLSRGASGKKLAAAPEGDKIILCEGIEDGLTLAMCCPDYRVHAAVSVGNFQNVRLPQTIREVILAVDNDGADSQASRAVQSAIDVFCSQGREVAVTRARVGKDFNDMLLSKAEEKSVERS